MTLPDLYQKIDNEPNSERLLVDLLEGKIEPVQFLPVQRISVLAHLLIKSHDVRGNFNFLKDFDLQQQDPEIKKLVDLLEDKSKVSEVLEVKLNLKTSLTKEDIEFIVDLSVESDSEYIRLTIILVLIKLRGLSDLDTQRLSISMANRGEIFDYRGEARLDHRKLIRRYPTGAVSEKIGLVMPSLLRCFSKDEKFVSPFLVAKSLGFTGGTWDKLSTVDGFTFPYPGEDSIKILETGRICMTVTMGEFNPSDRLLYKLRSLTNTVKSLPLIISSIASKQLANPVDHLLLDIRYGENAFLESKVVAQTFFKNISCILGAQGIKTSAEYTNTKNIFGSSIGNLVELIESVALMKNKSSFGSLVFSQKHLEKQRDLVFKMTCDLVEEFSINNREEIEKQCLEFLQSGALFTNFLSLLHDHGVEDYILDDFISESYFENKNLRNQAIRSTRNGKLQAFNQQKMGNFVNFDLNRPDIHSQSQKYGGIILIRHENDYVAKGDLIAYVFSELDYAMNDELFNLFITWKEN